jgi:peptide/nickel transport system substrate-binding protein
MRTDQPPFNDVRVRRAISMAIDRQALVAALGVQGQLTPAIPPGLVEWSLPIDQLGRSEVLSYDPRRPDLLAEAGFIRCADAALRRAARASVPISR